ncbi:MAG: NAD-dependent epimerase/dehydratase family protein [Thermoleophilia bacterium]
MSGELALVTGGGGFLGRAIVEQLLTAGYRVRSFARSAYPELAAMGVEVVRGDLVDEAAVHRACEGCAIVFHNAARAAVWGERRDFYPPNVRGTQNVLAACRAAGVRRLVYTSTASVVFGRHDICGGDESLPYPPVLASPYAATKAVAEQMVLAADGATLRTLSLRPHLIWGPGDTQIIPRLIAKARAGRLVRVGCGRNVVDTTYVDNAAAAHIRAADALLHNPAAHGRAYFISNGEPVNLWDLIDRIMAVADLPPVRRAVPAPLAIGVGTVIERTHASLRLRGEPQLTRFLAEELATSHWFDISAARRELGYDPSVSIDEGLAHLGVWLQSSASGVATDHTTGRRLRRG